MNEKLLQLYTILSTKQLEHGEYAAAKRYGRHPRRALVRQFRHFAALEQADEGEGVCPTSLAIPLAEDQG